VRFGGLLDEPSQEIVREKMISIFFNFTDLDRAVAQFAGSTIDPQRIDGLGTLDLHDIVSGFRAGSSAVEIVERRRRPRTEA
jgi:hypothetical protein